MKVFVVRSRAFYAPREILEMVIINYFMELLRRKEYFIRGGRRLIILLTRDNSDCATLIHIWKL
jgi:hypothetical protein